MKIKLVFKDWLTEDGEKLIGEENVVASLGSFHSGTCFEANIELNKDEQNDLLEQMNEGYVPIFEMCGVRKR